MATAVDISNLGLVHIGARAQVVAISPPDGTIESGLCARFYPLVRREVLEMGTWSFATKRVALATVDNPSTVWAYAYAVPSDCIRARRVLALAMIETQTNALSYYEAQLPGGVVDTVYTERAGAPFEREGNLILTNEPDAVLVYTYDVLDTNTFTARFVVAAGMLMASYLAGPIIKGEAGANAAARWREAATNYVGDAAASDANQSSQSNEFMPSHLAARA